MGGGILGFIETKKQRINYNNAVEFDGQTSGLPRLTAGVKAKKIVLRVAQHAL